MGRAPRVSHRFSPSPGWLPERARCPRSAPRGEPDGEGHDEHDDACDDYPVVLDGFDHGVLQQAARRRVVPTPLRVTQQPARQPSRVRPPGRAPTAFRSASRALGKTDAQRPAEDTTCEVGARPHPIAGRLTARRSSAGRPRPAASASACFGGRGAPRTIAPAANRRSARSTEAWPWGAGARAWSAAGTGDRSGCPARAPLGPCCPTFERAPAAFRRDGGSHGRREGLRKEGAGSALLGVIKHEQALHYLRVRTEPAA